LTFRYHDVPWAEHVIGQVQRSQEDEAFRQSPRFEFIRPLAGRLEELEDLLKTVKVDRQSDWQAAERGNRRLPWKRNFKAARRMVAMPPKRGRS
jgi:hypothetical protein